MQNNMYIGLSSKGQPYIIRKMSATLTGDTHTNHIINNTKTNNQTG